MLFDCFLKFLKTNREFNVLVDFVYLAVIASMCAKWIILADKFSLIKSSLIERFLVMPCFQDFKITFDVQPACSS